MVDRLGRPLAHRLQVLELFLAKHSIRHSFPVQVSLRERLSVRKFGIHVSQQIVFVLAAPLRQLVLFFVEFIDFLEIDFLLVVEARERQRVVLMVIIAQR